MTPKPNPTGRSARQSKRTSTTGFTNVTFDARPDRLDFRDKPYLPPLRSLDPTFPREADIAKFMSGYSKQGLILDQGSEGACTGFGLACVVNFLLFRRTPDKTFQRVSPRMLYELARRYDEWKGEDYDGSSCRGALKGWHKHGVCSEEHWRYRTRDGRVQLLKPAKGWEGDAVTRPIGAYYRIDRRSVVDLQAAIQQIGAIFVSASVHDGWDRVQSRKAPKTHAQIPTIPPADDIGETGGHAFALVGYNEWGFIVQNSWGSEWGAGGFAVMPYNDWVSLGTDAWAAALGVPQVATEERIESIRWPARKGRSLSFFDRRPRSPRNPPDDPWPIDREFEHPEHEPWSTARAFAHTLITGNDGNIIVSDITGGTGQSNLDHFLNRLLVEDPARWLKARTKPKLVVYAHGGLNSEDESIDRIRVLAPYLAASGVYPLFLTWRTGPAETIRSMLEDVFRTVFGVSSEEEMRAAGFLDFLADRRDRSMEQVAHRTIKGLWSEMRENAACSAINNGGLVSIARHLTRLRDKLGDRGLEVHLIGHSAGSILLGHLLPLLALPDPGVKAVKVASCTLYAAACSVKFAVEMFLQRGKAVLKSEEIHLHYLSERNEKDDFLLGSAVAGLHLYGKSLLYLISRALEDVRKIPVLGLERAIETAWHGGDSSRLRDQWDPDHLQYIEQWLQGFRGHLHRVDKPSITVNKRGKTVQAQHGAFDNDIETITMTIERISGMELPKPIEWLDY